MSKALGFQSIESIVELHDFDDSQVAEYLNSSQISWNVPGWLPARPLLIGYLVNSQAFDGLSEFDGITQATAWKTFFDLICVREAQILSMVRPEVIKAIIARVATLARAQGSEVGPIGIDLMKSAFIAINGRQPDEEGMQMLLRLPGLAVADDGNAGSESADSELRVFVDQSLAETAYAEDLASYVKDPYSDHPLGGVASWISAASDLGIDVAAQVLEEWGIGSSAVVAVASRRQDEGKYDAVLADVMRVASSLGAESVRSHKNFYVDGVMFENLVVSPDVITGRASYQNCVMQTLDISLTEEGQEFPHFRQCLIGFLEGASAVPKWLTGNFDDCEIEQYSADSQTTAGIMQLGIDEKAKVALTILKKIYAQRGSGRKEGSLSRGISQASRVLVPGVLNTLLSEGWVQRGIRGHNAIYSPVKSRRSDVARILEKPTEFRLPSRRRS
jgi:hypothetical protein